MLLAALISVFSGIGVLWKTLPTFIWPLSRNWVSQGISLGFVHLVSLYRSSLRQKSLDTISKALRGSLPLRVVEVHVERLYLSVGIITGLKLRTSGIRIVLEWTTAETWAEAAEDIRAAELGKAFVAANGLIQVARKGSAVLEARAKGVAPPKPSFLKARIIQSLAAGLSVSAEDVQLVIRSCADEDDSVIEIGTSVNFKSCRSNAVERGGMGLRLDTRFAVRAGPSETKDVLCPARLISSIELPRLIETLSSPLPLQGKKVIVDASVSSLGKQTSQGIAVVVIPAAVGALAKLGAHFGRFGKWKESIVDSAFSTVTPVEPGERETYYKKIANGEDVTELEKRMSTEDIVQAHREAEKWPVEAGVLLEDWFEQLKNMQKPVRSMQVKLKTSKLSLETLTDGEQQGQGVLIFVREIVVEAQKNEPETKSDFKEDETVLLHADVRLDGIQVSCENQATPFAVPILQPCALRLVADKKSRGATDALELEFRLRRTSDASEAHARNTWAFNGKRQDWAEQATHTFVAGAMGIIYDDNGFVQEISPRGQAHSKHISKGDQIVKVGTEKYSKHAVDKAEKSGAAYQVTFEVGITFKGKMGITCDDNGVVQIVTPDSQADHKGFKEGDRIIRISNAPFSRDALARAESGGSYQVAVRQPLHATVSSRAAWKLQRFNNALQASLPRPVEQDENAKEDALIKKAKEEAAARRCAQQDQVKRLFARLDEDGSGALEKQEVRKMIESMFDKYMTVAELDMSANQLFNAIVCEPNGSISLAQLQDYFFNVETETSRPLCLKLSEFRCPEPEDLDEKAVQLYNTTVASHIATEVLQLRWVRTLQNYKAAQRTWEEQIAETLPRNKREWMLSPDRDAYDFWSDTSLSVVQKHTLVHYERGKEFKLDVLIPGFRFQLADNQHKSAMPRVQVALQDIELTGVFEMPSSQSALRFEKLNGALQLHADYWNQQLMLKEPFLEPLRLEMNANGHALTVHAEQHMVVNVTPPLMQSITIATASLQNTGALDKQSVSTEAPILVRIRNCTLCNLTVKAKCPDGETRSTDIPGVDFLKPVDLELKHTWLQSRSAAHNDWTLQLKGADHQGPFMVDDITFSLSRRFLTPMYRVGRNGGKEEATGSKLAVDVNVDVENLAPVVTVSGITQVLNLTDNTLKVDPPRNGIRTTRDLSYNVLCGEAVPGPIDGGALRIAVAPEAFDGRSDGQSNESFQLNVPPDIEAMESHEMEIHSELALKAGYRFVLIDNGEDDYRSLICVPAFRVMNALPYDLKCKTWNLAEHTADDFESLAQSFVDHGSWQDFSKLASTETKGFGDVHDQGPLAIAIEVAGFTYLTRVPEGTIFNEKKIKRAKVKGAKQKGKIKLGIGAVRQLQSSDAKAPLLEVELDWEKHSARVIIFARYWIQNKFGWEVEISATRKVAGRLREDDERQSLGCSGCFGRDSGKEEHDEQQRVISNRPRSTTDASLDSARRSSKSICATDLALMRVSSDQICLRAKGGLVVTQGRDETPMIHWPRGVRKEPAATRQRCDEGAHETAGGAHEATQPEASDTADVGQNRRQMITRAATHVVNAGLQDALLAREEISTLQRQLSNAICISSTEESLEPCLNTHWSECIPVATSNTTGVAHLPNTSLMGLGQLSNTTDIGVQVKDLPSPFERTKLVNIAPRYIVMNRLDVALQLWPSMGQSRRAPKNHAGLLHGAIGAVAGSIGTAAGSIGIDAHLDPSASNTLPVLPPEGSCLAMDELPVQSTYLPTDVPLLSARVHRDDASTGGQWSVQIPMLTVGDFEMALYKPSDKESPIAVRVSVQLVGATFWIVLSPGQWPYCIENRSVQHTLVFYQDGAEDLDEWTLKPRECRRFALPDPDKPKVLCGRIRGSGKYYSEKYSFEDIGKKEQQPLFRPGTTASYDAPTLESSLGLEGLVRILRFRDARQKPALEKQVTTNSLVRNETAGPRSFTEGVTAVTGGVVAVGGAALRTVASPFSVFGLRRTRSNLSIDDDEYEQSSSVNSTFITLGVSVSLPGLHVSIVDAFASPIRELLALSVDYVHLSKCEGKQDIDFRVHHVQLDDFADASRYILGPIESGLNSQRDVKAEEEEFLSRPVFHVNIQGPTDKRIPVFDPHQSVLTLKTVSIIMRPLEVQVDVPRLLQVGDTLSGWTKKYNKKKPGKVTQARVTSELVLPKPRLGPDATLCISELEFGNISLRADVRLRPRLDDAEEKADAEVEAAGLEVKLRSLTSRMWTPLQVLVETILRMGASVAEVSPRFSFGEIKLNNVNSTSGPVIASLSKHYQQQAIAQTVRVLGSVQVLGDPVNLFSTVGGSVSTFVTNTTDKGVTSMGEGVKDLTGGVAGAACGFVSRISGSFRGAVHGVVGGDSLVSDRSAYNIKDGLDQGLNSLANGVSQAVEDLLQDPIDGAGEDGAMGFAKGSAHGVLGLFVRPVEGTLGAVEKISQGVEAEMRCDYRAYFGLRRPPRMDFCTSGQDQQSQAISFGPGEMGITCDDNGVVQIVIHDSQAHSKGIKEGDRIVKVGTAPFLKDALFSAERSRGSYQVTVRGDAPIPLTGVDEGFFWPAWTLKVLRLSLPSLWWDRQVKEVAISLYQSADRFDWSEVKLTRAQDPDTWALAEDDLKDNNAVGRVGQLRGPFRLKVDALVESNLEMTEPFRVRVGIGSQPTKSLLDALERSDGLVQTFKVQAEKGSQFLDALVLEEPDTLGTVVIQLARCVDKKILPAWFSPCTTSSSRIHQPRWLLDEKGETAGNVDADMSDARDAATGASS